MQQPRERDGRFPFYMDLAGHDMLNSNQAVLSYLELIMAAPDVTPKTKKYAEKAVSHVRSSTMLVENIRRLIASRSITPDSLRPVDLSKSITRSERELREFFPAKKISVKILSEAKNFYVLGNSMAEHLVLNMLVTLVRLDLEEEVEVTVRSRETTVNGKSFWVIRMEDPNAQLPPGMKSGDLESVESKDSSVFVKVAGLLYSKMISEVLGGTFATQDLVRQGERRGAAIEATLRRVGSP